MKTRFDEAEGAALTCESLRLALEESRRELNACRQRLAQSDELFEVYKRSQALLHGEKNITEMIARRDALEAILEGSCRLVEEALPGSLAIIVLLDGKRLRRGAAPSFPKYMAEVAVFFQHPYLDLPFRNLSSIQGYFFCPGSPRGDMTSRLQNAIERRSPVYRLSAVCRSWDPATEPEEIFQEGKQKVTGNVTK